MPHDASNSFLSFSVLLCTKYATPAEEDNDTPVNIHTMADDISNASVADSGQNGASPPDGDTATPLQVRPIKNGLDNRPSTHICSAQLSAKI